MSAPRTLATVLVSAAVARAVRALPEPAVTGWRRTNYQGREVSLSGGLAAAAGTLAGAALSGPLMPASLLAAGSAVLAGGYDDLIGARTERKRDKGLAGHLRAIASGRLSGGTVKVAVIGAGALLAARAISADGRRTTIDVLSRAALIAGSANLVNLFDLRPGRATKIVLASGTVAALTGGLAGPVAAAAGASAAILPDDLSEQTMLGDLGANPLGALIGVRLAAGSGLTRIVAGIVIGGMTIASERVSFTAVIDAVPTLRRLDQLGRRPAPALIAASP